MDIQGLQTLTLLDYPGKVACTVFLGGCNLRCPYCHNGELVTAPAPTELEDAALLAFLRKRQGLLDGVCITGGEPLLRPDLPDLLAQIRALGFLIKLDTNGAFPQTLKELVSDGLVDYVAMDIKNCPDRYGETVGVPDFNLSPIQESVRFLLSGAVDYEFRTTVVAEFHDTAAISAVGQWISGAKRYFLQSFVDRDTVIQPGLHPRTEAEMREFLTLLRPQIPSVQLRGL